MMTTAQTQSSSARPTGTPDDPAYQAFWLLRIGFTLAPILFGIDKYFHVLVNWDKYLSNDFVHVLPANTHQLMYVVGAVEIVTGLVVFLRPRFGSYLVAAWLAGIIINLLMIANYYDIALRDFGLFLAALTLARLASVYDPGRPFARPGLFVLGGR